MERGTVEWNSGMVGVASLLNELEAKLASYPGPGYEARGEMCCHGALSVDFKRIFNLLEGQPPHN